MVVLGFSRITSPRTISTLGGESIPLPRWILSVLPRGFSGSRRFVSKYLEFVLRRLKQKGHPPQNCNTSFIFFMSRFSIKMLMLTCWHIISFNILLFHMLVAHISRPKLFAKFVDSLVLFLAGRGVSWSSFHLQPDIFSWQCRSNWTLWTTWVTRMQMCPESGPNGFRAIPNCLKDIKFIKRHILWVVPPPSNSGHEGLGWDSLLKMFHNPGGDEASWEGGQPNVYCVLLCWILYTHILTSFFLPG